MIGILSELEAVTDLDKNFLALFGSTNIRSVQFSKSMEDGTCVTLSPIPGMCFSHLTKLKRLGLVSFTLTGLQFNREVKEDHSQWGQRNFKPGPRVTVSKYEVTLNQQGKEIIGYLKNRG